MVFAFLKLAIYDAASDEYFYPIISYFPLLLYDGR